MDVKGIRRALNKSMDFQFDCSYSWLDMIDDTDDLTDEEKDWAKEHSTYAVKIDTDEQQRDDLLATLKDLLAVVCPEYDGDYPYPLRDKIQQAEQAIANAEK